MSTLLWSLLQVTPADEGELLAELYSSSPELIKRLGRTNNDILILAAQENLNKGLPERSAELLNYGLQNIRHTLQNSYVYLLLAYAYERAGHYVKALEVLQKRAKVDGAEPTTLKLDNNFPFTTRDAEVLERYILLKTGALGKKEVLELERHPFPVDLSWAEAKRFNLLGTYYKYSAEDTQENLTRFDKAIKYFDVAKTLWENLGSKNNVVGELTNIAIAHAVAGNFGTADQQFEYALKQAEKLNVSALVKLQTLFSYASAQNNKGDHEKALMLFAECYKVESVNNYPTFLMRVSFNQGVIYDLHLKNHVKAEKCYELTRDTANSVSDQSMRGRAIASLGFIRGQKFLVDSGIQLIQQGGDTSDIEDYIQERDTMWPSDAI
jgi:tetratricopeptide (TPR) repeat protein